VGAKALSEWSLLPLRLFLGATFTFAGLQKLANPNFFDAKSPISIQSQLIAAAHTSPIHALLSHLGSVAIPVGVLIAVGEVSVGLGTLLGLFTRVAALGGFLLSLSLFLTVSFHASPFFTGADIVFFFAWMPFIVAGAGTQLSMDAWIKNRVAKEHQRPSPVLVPIAFAQVQSLCGNYQQGKCKARAGLACDAAACPVLLNEESSPPVPAAHAADRRAVVLGSALAAAVGTSVVISGAAMAVAGRLIDGAPKPKGQGKQLAPLTTSPTTVTSTTSPKPTVTTSPTTTQPAPAGQLLGSASQVPKNQAASFTIPSSGDPGIVIHTEAGEFVGYDAVCPHTGCTVGYSNVAKIIVCPCHGSEFQVSNGDVIVGPAPHGLAKLKIVEGANGNLYLQ
jgi:thiosulfate dehydrogenase [quinone] large subunit